MGAVGMMEYCCAEVVLSRREVSARQDAMTYLVRVRGLLSRW